MKKAHMFWRAVLFPLGLAIAPCKVMDADKYQKFDRGQIIISNHLSWMDVAYSIFYLPGYKRVLSKKENEGKGIKRHFLKNAIGVIFVNRDKPELSSMRECIGALNNGETLSVYPEGTRNRVNRELQEMHSGTALFALRAQSSVVPVAVHHKGKLFKRNYIGVGDRIYLDDLYGKRIDEALLQIATDRFREGLQKTLDKLDAWVEAKGWKADKKRKKAEKKSLKKQYKLAAKDAKKARKSKKDMND